MKIKPISDDVDVYVVIGNKIEISATKQIVKFPEISFMEVKFIRFFRVSDNVLVLITDSER